MSYETIRSVAVRQLTAMYRPDEGVFVFRRRRLRDTLVAEGMSRRYTAMTLIGLAGEDEELARSILGGQDVSVACQRLIRDAGSVDQLGDLAVLAWAARVARCNASTVWERLVAASPDKAPCATVDLSWVLSALCGVTDRGLLALRDRVAARLMDMYNPASNGFPHRTNGASGLRGHVACFADQVYPILALSQFAETTGNDRAVRLARETARHLCRSQGPAGQWWWHYDARTGAVIEGYPVYSVHQHAMAPMALRALERVSGSSFNAAIAAGMGWLAASPEIDGRSLIDPGRDTVWRKVARREPGKSTRYLQAVASRLRSGANCPGIERLFPPGAIDFECRPYEFGWFLYAWQDAAVLTGAREVS